MNFSIEGIILIVVRALGGQGKIWLEKWLLKIDEIVCNSPTELDNELWLNILLPVVKEHQSTCPPPSD